jgi:hypothetical protein
VNQFTLVRHSEYAAGGNPDFEDAVEVFELNSNQAYSVRAVGGVLLPTLAAGQAAARAENFPGGSAQSVPRASGYFSSLRLGGAEIYVPRAETTA